MARGDELLKYFSRPHKGCSDYNCISATWKTPPKEIVILRIVHLVGLGSQEYIKPLVEAAKLKGHEKKGAYNPDELIALVHLFFCGLARQEACGLKWGQVFTAKWQIRKKIQLKNGNMPVTFHLEPVLKDYRSRKMNEKPKPALSGRMFPSYGSEKKIYEHLEKHLGLKYSQIRLSGMFDMKFNLNKKLEFIARSFRMSEGEVQRILGKEERRRRKDPDEILNKVMKDLEQANPKERRKRGRPPDKDRPGGYTAKDYKRERMNSAEPEAGGFDD